MAFPVVSDSAVRELRAGFAGEVLVPGDAGYEDARTIFNAMIDRRPAVIAQCERVEDVAASIRFGRENYDRLAGVKAAYDPDNIVRLNHNIEPR